MSTLIEKLNLLIDQNNIKAVDLARAIDVNASTISRILKGTQKPAVETLYKCAVYLGVTMESLMSDEDVDSLRGCFITSSSDLTNEEELLLRYFRGMTDSDRDEIMMLSKAKYRRKKTEN